MKSVLNELSIKNLKLNKRKSAVIIVRNNFSNGTYMWRCGTCNKYSGLNY